MTLLLAALLAIVLIIHFEAFSFRKALISIAVCFNPYMLDLISSHDQAAVQVSLVSFIVLIQQNKYSSWAWLFLGVSLPANPSNIIYLCICLKNNKNIKKCFFLLLTGVLIGAIYIQIDFERLPYYYYDLYFPQ